jgi:hypothetical protein
VVDGDKVKKSVKKFEEDNGNKTFTTKELVIHFNTELKEGISEVKGNISDIYKYVNDHDKLIAQLAENVKHITDELPEKGFCEKTQNIINCWQPVKNEPPLDRKVDVLWYDRKMMKGVLVALIAAICITGVNIIVTIFT